MLEYKFDVLEKLKERGYTSYKIRTGKLLSESTVQKLRSGKATISGSSIDALCALLDCQPGDILRYIPDETE